MGVGGGARRQELSVGDDQAVSRVHSAQESIYTTVKTAEISPLRSGLMINEDSRESITSRQNVLCRGASLGLNCGFSEGNYSGHVMQQPQVYFRTKNIPVANKAVTSDGYDSTGSYNAPPFHGGALSQQSENANFVANTISGAQLRRLSTPSNGVRLISVPQSNGVKELLNQCRTSGYDFREGIAAGGGAVYQQPFPTQNLAGSSTVGGSSNSQIPRLGGANLLESLALNQSQNQSQNPSQNLSMHTGNPGSNSNSINSSVTATSGYGNLSERPLPSSRVREEFVHYEQYSSVNTRSFLSQHNSVFQTSYQPRNPQGLPFFSTNTSNQSQMSSMMSPQYLNSVPLLAQIRVESIQDLPNNIHHHSISVYGSVTAMDYSIVASFNNIDDKNETYRIGPFPSSSMSDSKLSCIVQDEISLPFSWSQPTLKLKILEENDFRADIIGVCSITIDMNSIGVPSQACLIDPQTGQIKGTLRFVIKLAPNQQNPNYRFDQIHGPNSILNRRQSHENSIFNIFKGFCCAD